MPELIPASQLAEAILEVLPGRVAEWAPKLGRKRTDRTIRRRLADLETAGVVENSEGIWSRCQTDPIHDTLPGYEFPDGFDAESRDQLRHKALELKLAEVPIDSFIVELLEAYIRCLQRARLANIEIDRDGLFQRAANGGRKFAHPGVATAREAERDAHVYREAIEKKKRADPDADPDDDLTGL